MPYTQRLSWNLPRQHISKHLFEASAVVFFLKTFSLQIKTNGQRILTKGRIACRAIIDRGLNDPFRCTALLIPLLRTLQQRLQCFSPRRTTPKHCPFSQWISTPSNAWFLRPTRVSPPNGISISSVVFAGLMNVTNRQIDRHTNSAAK